MEPINSGRAIKYIFGMCRDSKKGIQQFFLYGESPTSRRMFNSNIQTSRRSSLHSITSYYSIYWEDVRLLIPCKGYFIDLPFQCG